MRKKLKRIAVVGLLALLCVSCAACGRERGEDMIVRDPAGTGVDSPSAKPKGTENRSSAGRGNRLVSSKSPYLLQHARNPVDWYPWGEAAFRRAREEDKPVFLSNGYSTCHWC
ncbi:MAG: DUF255 domain-containing protein, partial [Planctomycetota bacterium]